MKTNQTSDSNHTRFICYMFFLLLSGFIFLSRADAAVFLCDTVDEINDALDTAASNDRSDLIFISPGEYSIPGEPLIWYPSPFENHPIFIGGVPWNKPILNGMGATDPMVLYHSESYDHESTSDADADITISDLVFYNTGGSTGLFAWTREADIRLVNCLFHSNYGFSSIGAGASLTSIKGGDIWVENNIFQDNTSDRGPGGGLGIKIHELCHITVVNNTFINNRVETLSGGAGMAVINFYRGAALGDWTVNVYNNIFHGNTAPAGRDLCVQDFDRFLSVNLYNNIMAEYLYNLFPRTLPDPSNVDIDPLLNPDHTPAPGSPSIDTGTHFPGYEFPGIDYLGQNRLRDGDENGIITVDRGAIELQVPGGSRAKSRLFRFIPDFTAHFQNIRIPAGPPYYLQIGDIAQNSDHRVGWSISNHRTVPSGYTLYYGDPAAGNYHTDQSRNSGTVTIPNVDLTDLQKPTLSFLLYMDTEPGDQRDTLKVWAQDRLLWEKTKMNVDMKKWQLIEIGLQPFAGKHIDLTLKFDTRDAENNRMEGVYIDEFLIQ